MKIARLSGLLLGLVFALSLVGASVASAVPPLFTSGSTGATYKANVLAGTLKAGTGATAIVVFCAKASSVGEITSVHLVGPLVIHFLECKSSSNAGETYCAPVNSTGKPGEGLILTKTLHALLGLALPSQLPALLFLPTSGITFVELEANACTPTTKITGSVAGLVSNARNTPSLTTLLTFGPKDPELIHTLLGLTEPELILMSKTATIATVAHLSWSKDIEIV